MDSRTTNFNLIHRVVALALAVGLAALAGCGGASERALDAPANKSAAQVAAMADEEQIMPTIGCSALAAVDIGDSVGAATRIVRSAEASLQAARYCIVEGVIAPAIRFEVRLPAAGWSGRYLQTGCGGLCGNLNIQVDHADSCVPVNQHQVVLASTDMGHAEPGGAWAARNPSARADFGYRGVHLTAVAARALIKAYYGQPPRYAYFSGCSDGGREALIEAQRYPEDFDGIAAGAPALNFTVQNSFYHAWNAVANSDKDGNAIIQAAHLPLLHAAVLRACDHLDGARDGVIEDPRDCSFDPAVLLCVDSTNNCLSAAQVAAVRKIYAGAHDAQGRKLVMAGPMPGSELGWAGVFVPDKPGAPILSRNYAEDTLRYLAYEQPLPATWSLRDFQFTVQTLQSFELRGLYDATNPDLSAFHQRGGKLLMWHGWADQHISPINSIGYYDAVTRRMGVRSTQSFARLFLIPGLAHCSGGEGPVEFDVLTALMEWVENGRAPAQLEIFPDEKARAAGYAKRPLYPYPDQTRRITNAAGQTTYRREEKATAAPLEWAGSGFFSSGYELDCDAGLMSQCASKSKEYQDR